MAELGADKPAFDTIVAAGENGAVPHHSPTGRELRAGDLVTIDFGARYQGYHADMTRTVSLGPPAAWQRELYDLVAEAQRAGRHALTPGRRGQGGRLRGQVDRGAGGPRRALQARSRTRCRPGDP
ncbi:M24 family metallopeptidase [Nonomuraea salmonea]|uniref:M24 family metallopeptidase n=1 Tax=Nonomuraea salmonea TaxID=46181 RepID=UPI0031E7D64F